MKVLILDIKRKMNLKLASDIFWRGGTVIIIKKKEEDENSIEQSIVKEIPQHRRLATTYKNGPGNVITYDCDLKDLTEIDQVMTDIFRKEETLDSVILNMDIISLAPIKNFGEKMIYVNFVLYAKVIIMAIVNAINGKYICRIVMGVGDEYEKVSSDLLENFKGKTRNVFETFLLTQALKLIFVKQLMKKVKDTRVKVFDFSIVIANTYNIVDYYNMKYGSGVGTILNLFNWFMSYKEKNNVEAFIDATFINNDRGSLNFFRNEKKIELGFDESITEAIEEEVWKTTCEWLELPVKIYRIVNKVNKSMALVESLKNTVKDLRSKVGKSNLNIL